MVRTHQEGHWACAGRVRSTRIVARLSRWYMVVGGQEATSYRARAMRLAERGDATCLASPLALMRADVKKADRPPSTGPPEGLEEKSVRSVGLPSAGILGEEPWRSLERVPGDEERELVRHDQRRRGSTAKPVMSVVIELNGKLRAIKIARAPSSGSPGSACRRRRDGELTSAALAFEFVRPRS